MSMTIKTRLTALVALTALFIIVIAANSLIELRKADREMEVMYTENMVGTAHLARIATLVRESRIQLLLAIQHDPSLDSSKLHDHPTDVHLNQLQKHGEELAKEWEVFAVTLDRDNKEQMLLGDRYLASKEKFFSEAVKPSVAAIKGGDYTKAVELTLKKVNPLAEETSAILSELAADEYRHAGSNYKKSEAAYHRSVKITVLLLVVAVASSGMLAFFVIRSITRAGAKLAEAAGLMAQGNLTARVEGLADDELGAVARAFNAMSESFGAMIGQVARTSERIAAAASHVRGSSEQMVTGAEQVATQATTVATAGEEMSATSGDIAANCGMAAEASRHASRQALDGAAVVQGTVTIMNRIAERVQVTSATISSLGERSDQIGAIIGTIEDIADQTNLLALNAAIEAARAGEQGRGFAVVADEVRALAERTTRATREIGDMIKAIQSETRAAVGVMEESVQNVEAGRTESDRSGASIQQILQQIGAVTTQINQIATAAEEQTATTSEISSNMMGINEVVQGTVRGAHESAQAAQQLSGIAEELQRMVAQFRLS